MEVIYLLIQTLVTYIIAIFCRKNCGKLVLIESLLILSYFHIYR